MQAGEVFPAAVRVRRPAYEPLGAQDIRLRAVALDDPRDSADAETRFLATAR